MSDLLPPVFQDWFLRQGWRPHAHQEALLDLANQGRSALLIAPTGGGKTLAGFLPSLVELAHAKFKGLHTLYISPLKALAVDIERNLSRPIREMELAIRCETRSGDTPEAKRQRQRHSPPQMLLTTPESLALLLSYPDAAEFFADLKTVIVDEIHALYSSKRGDLLALGLARLQKLAPGHRRVGLSATVADPGRLRQWLSLDGKSAESVSLVEGRAGAKPAVRVLLGKAYVPWAGHFALHALPEVYREIEKAGVTLVFVNTRAQAEMVFQELWRLNEKGLAIALHHGSLALEQRRKVEAAMAANKLKAVVATSSLDLGIDWGAVDLVIQMGAPKGAARLLQRIGRSNHRLDAPSQALLVPGNRFEYLECRAAISALAEGTLDDEPQRVGGLDVLAQHILGLACSDPIKADELYAEVIRAAPYADLPRALFDETLGFVSDGGYALKSYERFRRLRQGPDGLWRIATPAIAKRYRFNVGVIVEEPLISVRLKSGRKLGEVEEYFVQGLVPGDSFIFAGQILTYLGMKETDALVAKGGADEPKVPAYAGGRLPISTHLAERVRGFLAEPKAWRDWPAPVSEWLKMQRWKSRLPAADGLLVETFPHHKRHFLMAYCFEGRNAHQTLGMLLTRRMERAGLRPLGFVASDYAIAVWCGKPVTGVEQLFDQDMLGDDLEEWMAESSMLRRTFRNVAVIAGLIERRRPGEEKTRRQVTFSTDLIYDVLRKYQPDHILLRATRQDAAGGLTDIRRLADMLTRVKGKITHLELEQVSPLAVPVLLQIGREEISSQSLDEELDEGAQALIGEAMQGDDQGHLL